MTRSLLVALLALGAAQGAVGRSILASEAPSAVTIAGPHDGARLAVWDTWDHDGDGAADLLLRTEPPASGGAGELQVLTLRASSAIWDLATTPATLAISASWVRNLGYWGVGDVDGDGFDDVVLDDGTDVFVLRGRPSWPAVVDLGADPLTTRIRGIPGEFRADIGVGDVDGDGRADVILSAYRDDLPGRGRRLRFVHGRSAMPGALSFADATTIVSGFESRWGSVEVADVTHDGLADVAVSGPGAFLLFGRASWPAIVNVGAAPGPDRLLTGSGDGGLRAAGVLSTGRLDLTEYNASSHGGTRAWRGGPSIGLDPPEMEALPADSDVVLASAADADGDGMPDLVLEARWANGPRNDPMAVAEVAGEVHVFRGPITNGVFDLADRHGDFIVYGTDAIVVADVTGDGRPDVVAPSPRARGLVPAHRERGLVRILAADMAADDPVSDRHVDPAGGDDASDGLSWPAAKRTLAAALASLDRIPGRARVLVAPGTVEESVRVGAGITLLGSVDPATGLRDPIHHPTIVRSRYESAIHLSQGRGIDAILLDGFVVTGGHGRSGAAIRVEGEGPARVLSEIDRRGAVVANSLLRANRADGYYEQLAKVCSDSASGSWWSGWECCARPGLGSAVVIEPAATATFFNVLIEGNAATGLPVTECNEPAPPAGWTCEDPECEPGDFPLPATIVVHLQGSVTLRHVTVAGNAGEGLRVDPAGLALVEASILHGQTATDIGGPATIVDSIAGSTLVPGAILADPLFVDAIGGDHRLGAVAATQPADSPALDASRRAAMETCLQPGVSCLHEMTTRTDGMLDEGPADLGFHWTTDLPPIFAGVRSVAVEGECALLVSWDGAVDPEGTGAIRYRVFRGRPGSVDLSRPIAIVDEPTRSVRDAGLAWGETWAYVVQAEDSPGHVDGNTVEAAGTAEDLMPPRLAWLTASGVAGACEVQLSFGAEDSCSGVAAFDVHRSLVPGFIPSASTLAAAGVSSPHLDAPPSEGNWLYRVMARDGAGRQSASMQADAQATGCGGGPLRPGEAALTALTWFGGVLRFRIEPAPGADFHRTYRGELSSLRSGYGHAVSDIASCRHDGTSFDRMEGTGGPPAYFLVVGVNVLGEGSYGRDSFGRAIPDAAALGTATCP